MPREPSREHEAMLQALERLAPLPQDARSELSALMRPLTFQAGSFLLRGGELAESSFFVMRGLVRELYIAENGAEHTRTFVKEGQFTGSLLDLLSGQPSVTWIQALEPTDVLVADYRAWNALCPRYPALEHCLRCFTEELYVRKARREHDMLALSARERHDNWLAQHQDLDARIRRQHLASYLGITPEHLSRLRRR